VTQTISENAALANYGQCSTASFDVNILLVPIALWFARLEYEQTSCE